MLPYRVPEVTQYQLHATTRYTWTNQASKIHGYTSVQDAAFTRPVAEEVVAG